MSANLFPRTFLIDGLKSLRTATVTNSRRGVEAAINDLVDPLNQLGFFDLSTQFQGMQRKLPEINDVQFKGVWSGSAPWRRASDILKELEAGVSLEKLGEPHAESGQSPSSGIRLSTGEPTQRIRGAMERPPLKWSKYVHPENGPVPEMACASAAHELAYTFNYIAGVSRHSHPSETESFYGISGDVRRRIDRQDWLPNSPSRFPTAVTESIIRAASGVHRVYGSLMTSVLERAAMEAFGWSMTPPRHEESWAKDMLFGLQHYFAYSLLTKARAEELRTDPYIETMATGKAQLDETEWHRGKTRRSIMTQWINVTTSDDKEEKALAQRVGNKILRSWNFTPPTTGTQVDRAQWMLRYWWAHYHFGVLPRTGLAFPSDQVSGAIIYPTRRFSHGLNVNACRKLTGDFFSAREWQDLAVYREWRVLPDATEGGV